ncbi:unnamed protein product, partial [Hapterophycus canaliculatus]
MIRPVIRHLQAPPPVRTPWSRTFASSLGAARYHFPVFGLGMAGRVVVEGAPFPRGLLVEAYVPASCETCELFLSVEDLKLLFLKDPENMSVGKKGDMVLELVKMLYFDYTLETE